MTDPTAIETTFTPLASLAGGMLIGAAAVMLMLLRGRVAGATGVLRGALFPDAPGEAGWRWAMLAGMVSGPVLMLVLTGAMPDVSVPVTPLMLVVGGVLVGMGVTLANGCTSGHGVCGMARLSPRSIAATLTFMASTGATVFVVRHVVGG